MKKKQELLNDKLNRFEDEYNLYAAEIREKLRQENSHLSGSGQLLTLFFNLEKQLITEWFNGYTPLNLIEIKGFNKLHILFYKKHHEFLNDKLISSIQSKLESDWQKRIKNYYEYLEQATCGKISDITSSTSLNRLITFEINRFINELHELQIDLHIPLHKRFLALFTPIGAAVGFLTGVIQFYLLIKPIINK